MTDKAWGNFWALQEAIPYIEEGEKHSVVLDLSDDVRIKQPGKYKHLNRGGDFVVDTKIGDSWVPLKHTDYFGIVEEMMAVNPEWCRNVLAPALVALSKGKLSWEDIDKVEAGPRSRGVSPRTFLRTIMAIIVAEYRRGAQYEPVGGRNLILRFLIGIIYENWTADEAAVLMRKGKTGLRMLRAEHGKEPSFNEILEV